MRPIAFMRLRQLDVPEDILRRYAPKDLVVEQKYDGFKVMATRDRSGTKLYSRNGKDLTAKAPGIVKRLDALLSPGSTRLGEMTYVVKGQQELGLVQSVLHSATASRAIRQTKELGGKLEFVMYDALEEGGRDVSQLPFVQRRALLKGIPARGAVHVSKLYTWAKRKEAMRDSIKAGGEGMVVKVRSAPYLYRKAGASEPFGEWWKHKVPGKKSHTEDVILFGYAKREKRLAFEMYQIDASEKRVFVGYVSNLPRITERSVQKMSDRGKAVVAEISHQERFPSGRFRHPGWIRLRPDKPLKSATMTRPKRGKMAKVKRNPKGTVTIGRSASGELQAAMDSHFGRQSRGRYQNPRNSKVKDALAAEATRFTDFDKFARAYWDACSRGLYWVATDEKRFHIGEHERKQISSDRFSVSCSPTLALAGNNEGKKYVAELDVTRVPGDSIRIKRGTDGAEIKITGSAGSVKVTRVLDADQAMSAFKWQLSILPSSKEELRRFWDAAWVRRRKADVRKGIRTKKEKERGQVRAAAQVERDAARADRRAKKKKRDSAAARAKAERAATRKKREREKKEREQARRDKAKAAADLRAKKAAESKKPREKRKPAAKKKAAKKKASKKTGTWKRVPAPNPSKPSQAARKIPAHVNNPGC